ncbi:MAG: helix-turn-helix transcriptional regulator [Burkholderiales bacterium]|jgi:ribosome-binding protein aMBF1 (putative translation factor)|nr:helix-turn-helix transcriptional regulator [Burkholderiales bacterium]
MREDKRKRLAARGWKTGSAADFLGLSVEEARYVELRLRLSEGIRERRQRRHLTQTELARALRSSQSRVAKMEAGDPSVSLDLLVRSLLALGASNKDLAKLIG